MTKILQVPPANVILQFNSKNQTHANFAPLNDKMDEPIKDPSYTQVLVAAHHVTPAPLIHYQRRHFDVNPTRVLLHQNSGHCFLLSHPPYKSVTHVAGYFENIHEVLGDSSCNIIDCEFKLFHFVM